MNIKEVAGLVAVGIAIFVGEGYVPIRKWFPKVSVETTEKGATVRLYLCREGETLRNPRCYAWPSGLRVQWRNENEAFIEVGPPDWFDKLFGFDFARKIRAAQLKLQEIGEKKCAKRNKALAAVKTALIGANLKPPEGKPWWL